MLKKINKLTQIINYHIYQYDKYLIKKNLEKKHKTIIISLLFKKKLFNFVFILATRTEIPKEDSHNWYCSSLENCRAHAYGGSSPSSSAIKKHKALRTLILEAFSL